MKEMLLAAALLVPFVVTTTKAEPTAQAVAGFTAVDLSDTFVDALGALGVTPASIAPGPSRSNCHVPDFRRRA